MKLPLAAACALAASFVPIAHAQQRPFDAWLQDFRSSALAARISPAIVDAALTGLTPLNQVIERDRAQPEFTLDFRSYLTRVVSQSRIEEGQLVLAEHGELLRNIGQRYGMPPELLAAVWGVESNYGRTQGDFSVVQALATLAYDGRRGRMFRSELLNALRSLDQGHVEQTVDAEPSILPRFDHDYRHSSPTKNESRRQSQFCFLARWCSVWNISGRRVGSRISASSAARILCARGESGPMRNCELASRPVSARHASIAL
jgi:hypothetical protein